MLNPRKVIARESSTLKDREKKYQRDYEVKVYDLLIQCKIFVDYLGTTEDKFSYENISKAFKKQMKKNKMLSRTSRILNTMSKELSKFESKTFPEDLKNYLKIFNFKPERPNEKTGYMKRSAIDDKDIVDIFKKTMRDKETIPGALKRRAAELQEEAERSKRLVNKKPANKGTSNRVTSSNRTANKKLENKILRNEEVINNMLKNASALNEKLGNKKRL